ncbi:carbohydrate ABC transporter substrate-binding protein [Zooshikella ganghwensis]|uniref:Carbohydrate ABC transporter substrate-binding protein n=1 Tax=Zooshikella ganghwensis TaxID=202772 RepID=A0A4P9VUP3_9GAMM|nr:carbohydrate ABC transporter substrate-binding protein [Zooshikella ganghwensis]
MKIFLLIGIKTLIRQLIIFLLALQSFQLNGSQQNFLDVTVLNVGAEQGKAYRYLAREFEQRYPSVKVRILPESDANYKVKLMRWLTATEGPDVMYWQGGERLFNLVRKDLILPINDLWQQQQWETSFSQGIKNLVKFNNQYYAIPVSYYHWGIYYNEAVFKKYRLSPPNNWQGLLKVCDTLSKAGKQPIIIGNKGLWPAMGWFDYFNLRINGIDFHNRLLQGKESFLQPQVKSVFTYWKQLLDQQCLVTDYINQEWFDILPEITREKAAMILIGHFVVARAGALKSHLNFFRFPTINTNIPVYEEAPTDLYFIPHNTKNLLYAKRFLEMLGSPDIQHQYNRIIKNIPPHYSAPVEPLSLIQQGKNMLDSAAGITQYFDRDSQKEFVELVLPSINNFLEHRDINQIISELEKYRIKIFKQK